MQQVEPSNLIAGQLGRQMCPPIPSDPSSTWCGGSTKTLGLYRFTLPGYGPVAVTFAPDPGNVAPDPGVVGPGPSVPNYIPRLTWGLAADQLQSASSSAVGWGHARNRISFVLPHLHDGSLRSGPDRWSVTNSCRLRTAAPGAAVSDSSHFRF